MPEGEAMADNDDIDYYLRAGLAGRRKATEFWDWPDRPVKEHGIASEILCAGGLDVTKLEWREEGKDPPDCEGVIDGRWSGIEVTELVHRKSLERSSKRWST